MEDKKIDNQKKWTISFYTGVLFFIIAAPFTYKLVNGLTTKLLNLNIADFNGCPNLGGVALHAVVFTVLIRLMMDVRLPGVEENY